MSLAEASNDPLWQYGAVGILAALALGAARVLFKRLTEAHAEQRAALIEANEREKARADRLEAELTKLNTAIQERYLTALSEANRAIAEAIGRMRGH